MTGRIIAAGILFLGLSWAGLSGAGDKKREPIPTFTEEDAGKTFPLEKGSKARLKLKSNPSTGFAWITTKHDPKKLKLVSETVEKPKKVLPGAPVHQLFEYQALEPGKTELELVYRRPFEKGVKPAKTFKITFEVK